MGESEPQALVPYGARPTDVVAAVPTASLPAIVVAAGPKARKRFLEFFAAELRNPKTRRAYVFATARFTAWCEARGISLERIEPVLVAAYVEELQRELAAPSVKQHLAAIRRLFDYLVTGGVLPHNPASSVRGPKHVVKVGKTPVLQEDEARPLFESIDGGGVHVDAYVHAAKIGAERNSPLFRATVAQTGLLTDRALTEGAALRIVKRRAAAAGLPREICCHTFRATGITSFLLNGGELAKAQRIANHESPRTTELYNRVDDEVTLDEIERIRI